jgi:hypothetical protein
MLELARARGFTVVDTAEVVEAHCEAEGSRFAGAALYVDHCHYSRLGLARIAERVPRAP